ncbi:30S ribosomal protein S8 [Candidatus Karelsulcia muelleri CARI]|uniref:Small ribosomal subunit protein uS8 n=1 Tax=Karelsulcia muelleri (strain CARI) TaxID=706194 RepID=E0TJS3_KARMC|nr:30S ribosomal protein S8 [Candidatus Karelsulcia muelleri CARI]
MITDKIADCLTIIRNGYLSKNLIIEIPFSNLKKDIIKILYNQGFISSYKIIKINKFKLMIKVAMKYNKYTGISVIKCIKRISKPSLRKYCNYKNIPRVLNGLGIAIISTSKGLMTDKKARENKIGGEIICYIY